jgi:hypothetical protein
MATKKKIPKKTAIKAHTKPTTKTIKKAQPKKAITTRKTARNLTAKHKSLQEEFETLKAQATRTEKKRVKLATQLKALKDKVIQSESDTIRRIEKEIINAKNEHRQTAKNFMRQIESTVRLQHYFGDSIMLPPMHDWLISPDFGVLLVELIEENVYDAVIEFGSGTSTLIAAKALRKASARTHPNTAPMFSFDHLGEYLENTKRRLSVAALSDTVDLIHAPLMPWKSANGMEFSYYDCREALLRLKSLIPDKNASILVVVDGPPAATGPMARFPALPIIFEILGKSNRYHFLLDDMIREDEKQVVNAWLDFLRLKNLHYKTKDYKHFEKQALLVAVN